MWPPGISGNPNGRPIGSRTVFSQGFLKDLASVWAERGRAAMEKTAIDQPGVFFATCVRLIGPEVKLTITDTPIAAGAFERGDNSDRGWLA